MNEALVKNSFLVLTFAWAVTAGMSFIVMSDPIATAFLTDFLFFFTIIGFAPWAILGAFAVMNGMAKG